MKILNKLIESNIDDDTLYFINKRNQSAVTFEKQGGKWVESENINVDGFGNQTYMGYLSPSDLITYLSRDFGGGWKQSTEEQYYDFLG